MRDGHLGHLPHQTTCIKRTSFSPFHYADNGISAECTSAWTIKDNLLQQKQTNFILIAAAGHIIPAEVRKFCRNKVLSAKHSHSACASCVLLFRSYRQKIFYFCLTGIPADLQRYKPPQTQLSFPHLAIRDRKMNRCMRGKKPSWKCAETIEACHSSSLETGSTAVTEALWDLLG